MLPGSETLKTPRGESGVISLEWINPSCTAAYKLETESEKVATAADSNKQHTF
jgi:hypothetical protein